MKKTKDIFKDKDIIRVRTLNQYVKIINDVLTRKDKNGNAEKYCFRGISNLSQSKLKIFRNISDGSIDNEYKYIEEYEKQADNVIPQYNSFLDFVVACDYYGLKTRFIDWSTSPFRYVICSIKP